MAWHVNIKAKVIKEHYYLNSSTIRDKSSLAALTTKGFKEHDSSGVSSAAHPSEHDVLAGQVHLDKSKQWIY